MDFWQKARTFAEETAREAAKRSQELTREAAKRSQDITIGSSRLADIVSEASKRSKEIAAEAVKKADILKAEAAKKADIIKLEALRRADQIKAHIPPSALEKLGIAEKVEASAVVEEEGQTAVAAADLEKFGVTDELREFVKEITITTFRNFPLQDDSEVSDIPTVSNVRQDLTKWQEIHAKLVLTTVKEISKLRYELCPRYMKERKFWRIYFILVNSHVAPYEKRYMDDMKRKSEEEVTGSSEDGISPFGAISKTEVKETNQKSKSAASSATEQDLDVFLLGDLDSDEGPDDKEEGLDDDFDKL